MKTLQPEHDSISMEPSKDRSDLSDMYLKTGDFVDENDADRRAYEESHPELPSGPLRMRQSFNLKTLYPPMVALAMIIGMPFIMVGLFSIGGGDGGSVIAGVSGAFMAGIILVLSMRALNAALDEQCMKMDIDKYLLYVLLIPAMLLQVVYTVQGFAKGSSLQIAIVIVLAAALYTMVACSLYLFVHRIKSK